ncbi:ParB/RepB/Spo0J family partition protein [Microbacterium sp.]|uniref:ParB/RepB/Spo0J family partition protein n=1 Tax=Microbacterium sp. TaxID=51671 RepID=UPI000929C4FF|nr:ParB/RepB/Spo0J family partition protein [Microbacterium sp.]MBN9190222.1 ParB/RepB/Spo0J family partition protein [Microbacterium sp.]MBN9191933.1 ParB/RepB/Spo0J family partition protein [Microbacterium sp.]OJU67688.1 MAG: hypothetical protein BGO04_09980 [Microbacterium sp. 70-38]
MAESSNVRVASPSEIRQNPENPRLVFHEKELIELQDSIAANGILVPLTVFSSREGGYVLLDGERRWRSARKLGLHRVPIIVQPEPTLIQNIMMMFAIHNARSDWDPLPTAMKLQKLEHLYAETEGQPPTESQLAQLASLSRGEVRRLKNILKLPPQHLALVESEQDRPRSEQTLTVDHLLEVTRGAAALEKQDVIASGERIRLETVLIDKFRSKTLTSTVEPRLLARMARAVERHDVSRAAVRASITELVDNPNTTVRDAFATSVERVDREHTVEMSVQRLEASVSELSMSGQVSATLREALESLQGTIARILGQS